MGPIRTDKKKILPRGGDIYSKPKIKINGTEKDSLKDKGTKYLEAQLNENITEQVKSSETLSHTDADVSSMDADQNTVQGSNISNDKDETKLIDKGEEAALLKESQLQAASLEVEDSTDYSDWEGPEQVSMPIPSSSILKQRDHIESDPKLTQQEIEAAKSHYVYPEQSAAVLKASLQKAMLAARRAAIYGFPEPSIYRDDGDSLEEEEDEEFSDAQDADDVDYGSTKKKKNNSKKAKNKKKQNTKAKPKEKQKSDQEPQNLP